MAKDQNVGAERVTLHSATPERRTLGKARLLGCGLLLATTACSAVIVRPVPASDEGTGYRYCHSWGWPAADAGAAVGIAVLTASLQALAAGGAAYSDGCELNCARSSNVTPEYAAAALFAASALYGLIANKYCSDSLDAEQKSRLRQLRESLGDQGPLEGRSR